MNFDELEKTWNQQSVAGNRVFTHGFRQLLVSEIHHRTQSLRRVIGVGVFVACVGWAVALAGHYTGIRRLNAVTLTVFIAGSLFDLGFFVPAILSLRQMRREAATMGETLFASLRSSLQVVDWQIRNCTLLGYAMLVGFVGSTLAFGLEYFTHNLPARGLIAGTIGTFFFTIAIAGAVRRYRNRDLLPRREELLRQIAALEA